MPGAFAVRRRNGKSMVGKSKVGKVLGEFKRGKLKSSSGSKVVKRKQAVAIGLSEARKAGANIPKPNSPIKNRLKKLS